MAGASVLPAAQGPAPVPTSSFHLYLIGHDIGRETDTVTRDARGQHLQSTFHYDDRGAAIDLAASLDLTTAGLPTHLVVKGKTYRYFSSDTDVIVEGARAHIRDGGGVRDVDVDAKAFFPLDGYAPVAAQEELIRYWYAHRKPAEILAPPAGSVQISWWGGRISNFRTGRPPEYEPLDLLAIRGLVWGTEYAWVGEDTHQLVALSTWAGALPFEATRDGYSFYSRESLLAATVQPRILELEQLSKNNPAARTEAFALTGATVIDGTGRGPIPMATVVVRGGRIAAVGPSSEIAVPNGIPTVDVSGRTVISGLWDTHAHASQVDWAPVYLASGVTTIRDMGGETDFLTAFRDAVDSGRAFGPRILLAGLVDGPGPRAFGSVWAATPDEGRAVVRDYKSKGFDEIKIYSLVTPDVVKAIADEAHSLGMMVTGHIPNGMNARSAVEAGFDQIAHMPINGQPGSQPVKDLIAFFLEHHTAIDPTESWNELLQHAAATPIESFQPGVSRLPPALARMILSTPGTATDPAAAHARLLQSLQLVHEAQQAGVPVVAGTDKGVPGFSVQREIELYVEGGMTPLEAIQSATIVPARVMKLDKDTGTVEVGKRADLVILSANPLERISNIRTAQWVVANGRLYECAALWQAAGYR